MSDKEQRIRVRAYAIWEGEGRHDGRAEERWRQAELEIEQALRSAEAQAAEAPEQPPKATGNRAKTSTKATQTGAIASGFEGASRKPTTSRKKASVDATSSKVRQKPTATRSRRTPPA
jgi:hypothetical protein